GRRVLPPAGSRASRPVRPRGGHRAPGGDHGVPGALREDRRVPRPARGGRRSPRPGGLAALGPKVLELSAARAAGAHPYLTTPEHDGFARKIMGPSALLAPEHKVVVGTDTERARAIGRKVLKRYLALVNYRSNLLRLGFS